MEAREGDQGAAGLGSEPDDEYGPDLAPREHRAAEEEVAGCCFFGGGGGGGGEKVGEGERCQ